MLRRLVFLGFVTPLLCNDRCRVWVMAELGYIIKCQSTEASGKISYPGFACAVRTWKYGTLFPCDFVSGSLYLDVWVLHVECGTWDSSGDDFGCSAKLGSTMVTCSASALRFGELRIFSTLPWTRILKCLVFVLTQCSVDASVSVLVALLAPGNLEILSRVSRGWR